jgi:hypothetical protein
MGLAPGQWFKRFSFKACHVPRGFPSPFKAIQTYSRVLEKIIIFYVPSGCPISAALTIGPLAPCIPSTV